MTARRSAQKRTDTVKNDGVKVLSLQRISGACYTQIVPEMEPNGIADSSCIG